MTHTTATAGVGFGAGGGGGSGPAIQSQGHSGCEVKLVRRDGVVLVEKTSEDVRYNLRLRDQIQKQRSMGDSNYLPFVRIPRIVEEGDRGGLMTATMEYVYYLDSIDYFSTASIVGIDQVVTMIASFIDAEVAGSTLTEVPVAAFVAKLDGIDRTLAANGTLGLYHDSLTTLRRIVEELAPIVLPVGRCHGDLTFSNIMISSDSRALALIDFLDSFVESPIIDIAKVRQDSRFCWSLLMASREVDPVRFRLVMRNIDERLNAHYASHAWYSKNIDFILAMNLLRIAPYAKRQDVHEFLLAAIRSLELNR